MNGLLWNKNLQRKQESYTKTIRNEREGYVEKELLTLRQGILPTFCFRIQTILGNVTEILRTFQNAKRRVIEMFLK